MLGRRSQDLPLVRKILLIPALTALLAITMLGVAAHDARTNTEALRTLDRDVFEPLHAAHRMQDGLTLTHANIAALLLKGAIEADRTA